MSIIKPTSPSIIGNIEKRFHANDESDLTAFAVTVWVDFDSKHLELDDLSVPCPKCHADTDDECVEDDELRDSFNRTHYDRRMTLAAVRVLFKRGFVNDIDTSERLGLAVTS